MRCVDRISALPDGTPATSCWLQVVRGRRATHAQVHQRLVAKARPVRINGECCVSSPTTSSSDKNHAHHIEVRRRPAVARRGIAERLTDSLRTCLNGGGCLGPGGGGAQGG